jgi:hypothetical protein
MVHLDINCRFTAISSSMFLTKNRREKERKTRRRQHRKNCHFLHRQRPIFYCHSHLYWWRRSRRREYFLGLFDWPKRLKSSMIAFSERTAKRMNERMMKDEFVNVWIFLSLSLFLPFSRSYSSMWLSLEYVEAISLYERSNIDFSITVITYIY